LRITMQRERSAIREAIGIDAEDAIEIADEMDV
jgi:hypothetical protein